MKNGYGSPFVRVFGLVESTNIEVIELSLNITSFVYKYDEKENDTCQFKIVTNNPNELDNPWLQEGAIIQVSWGYITDNSYTSRIVKLSGISSRFSDNLIEIDVLCTDLGHRLKLNSSKRVFKGNIEQIAKIIASEHGMKFDGVFYGNSKVVNGELDVKVQKTKSIDDNTKSYSDINISLRDYNQLPQANKSDYQLLLEAINGDPNGPFDLVVRDNSIRIKKRNLNQSPSFKYTYGESKGELLSFIPESKDLSRKKDSVNLNITTVNPETKEVFETNTNSGTTKNTKLGNTSHIPPVEKSQGGNYDPVFFKQKGIKSPLNVSTYLNSKKQQTDLSNKLAANINIYKNFQYKRSQADKVNKYKIIETQAGKFYVGSWNTASTDFTSTNDNLTVNIPAIDETRVTMPRLFRVPDTPPVAANTNHPTPEHNIEDAVAKSSNILTDNELEKNPAEIVVIGNTAIESGLIVNISNVSVKYSGNYFIKSCEHNIDFSQGYIVTMSCTRNSLNSTGNESKDIVKIDELNNQLNQNLISNNSIESTSSIINDNSNKNSSWTNTSPKDLRETT